MKKTLKVRTADYLYEKILKDLKNPKSTVSKLRRSLEEAGMSWSSDEEFAALGAYAFAEGLFGVGKWIGITAGVFGSLGFLAGKYYEDRWFEKMTGNWGGIDESGFNTGLKNPTLKQLIVWYAHNQNAYLDQVHFGPMPRK